MLVNPRGPVYIVPREVYRVCYPMWSCLYCTQRGIPCWLAHLVLCILYQERCTVLVGPLGPVYIIPREVYRVGWPTWSCVYYTKRGVPCWLAHVVLSILYPERCTVLVNPRGPVYIVPRELYRVCLPHVVLSILYPERCTVFVNPCGPVYIVPREVYRVGWPMWSCLYCTQRGVPCWLTHVVLSILYPESYTVFVYPMWSCLYCTQRGIPCLLTHVVLFILYPERCTVLVGPCGPVYIVPREVYRVCYPTWSCLYCTQRGIPCLLTHVVLFILYPERCTVLVGPCGPVYIVPREVYRVGWPTWSCLYCTQRGIPCLLTHVVLFILYPERYTVFVSPCGPVYIVPRLVGHNGWLTPSCQYAPREFYRTCWLAQVVLSILCLLMLLDFKWFINTYSVKPHL